MLNYIAFKNYKAFQSGELEIKPLTILLGANSSGKSSLIKLIMMLTQSINYQREYKSLLKLNGDYANLGEIQNIFYQQNTSQPLTLSFKINTSELFTQLQHFDSFMEFMCYKIHSEVKSNKLFSNIRESILVLINDALDEKRIFTDRLTALKKAIKKIKAIYTQHKLNSTAQGIEAYFSIDFNSLKEAHELVPHILKEQDTVKNITYEISFQVQANSKTPYINALLICFDNKIFIKYSKERKRHTLSSEYEYLQNIDKYHKEFSKKMTTDKIFTKIFEYNFLDNVQFGTVDHMISLIFNICNQGLTEYFNEANINYITPLRASPKRYYFLDEFNVNSSLNTIDGDNLTEVLKENSDIKRKVNAWLQKYGLNVDVAELQNEIHSLKIGQYGLNLSVQDVGFGISQVLPIIVQGFLSQKNSLTLIEQPEIHLHPKMQAELTDLFLDIVSTKKNLLIETHSEYFLKRLRRRIAEGKISSNDVAIYYVEPDGSGKGSKISKIDISRTGAFEWPRDFYADDLEDTIEFLKHQKNDDNSFENELSTKEQTIIHTQSEK